MKNDTEQHKRLHKRKNKPNFIKYTNAIHKQGNTTANIFATLFMFVLLLGAVLVPILVFNKLSEYVKCYDSNTQYEYNQCKQGVKSNV